MFFFPFKDVKAAILEDILILGKDGGLKSFEQVSNVKYFVKCQNTL